MVDTKPVKLPERKVLSIIAVVLGGLALALSWVPIVNNVAAIFAVIGALLAIIAFFRNRGRKKVLSWIGLILSVLSFAIVLGTQEMYGQAADEVSKSIDKSVADSDGTNTDALAKNVQIAFGQFEASDETFTSKLPVTIKNTSKKAIEYQIDIQAYEGSTKLDDPDTIDVKLKPGETASKKAFEFVDTNDYAKYRTATFKVDEIRNYGN